MIDFSEIEVADIWEAFARVSLVTHELTVEVPPGRGADGGSDLLI